MAEAPQRRIFAQPLQEAPTRTQVSPENVGAPDQGVLKAGRAISDQVRENDLRNIAEEERAQILSISNQVDELKHDVELKAKSTRGRNAQGVDEQSQQEFERGMTDIEAQAFTSSQKFALEEMRMKSESHIQKTATTHMMAENEKAKSLDYAAKQKNLLESSLANYSDPDRVADNAIDFVENIVQEADSLGLDGDARQAFVLEKTSAYHMGIFNKMLNQKEKALAEEYLEMYGDTIPQINASTMDKMKKGLEESDFRGRAQDATDKIMAEKKGDSFTSPELTWPERFAKAKEIEDPELRDEVAQRLKAERSLQNSLEKERLDGVFHRATIAVEENPGKPLRDLVNVEDWNDMSLEMKNALKRHAAFSDPANNAKNDWDAFFKFYSLSPQKRAEMSNVEFRAKYWSRLDEKNRNKIFTKWQKDIEALRSSQGKALEGGILSEEEVITAELRELGWIPKARKLSGDEKLRNDRLMSAIDDWLIDFKIEHKGEEPSKEAIRKEVRRLTSQEITVEGDKKKLFEFNRETIRQKLNEGKVKTSLSETRGGIKRSVTLQIENYVKSQNLADEGTEEFRRKVREIAAAFQSGNAEAVLNILQGRKK
jgi:hypothetical protein